MKAYEKIDILLHQSHCSIVPENTALLFPNLLHFIFPKSLYFFFLFTPDLSAIGAGHGAPPSRCIGAPTPHTAELCAAY